MKKIGICTLYDAINFGATLQAFSLQEVLKKLGYNPSFIKFDQHYKVVTTGNMDKFEKSKQFLNIEKDLYNKETDKFDTIIIGSDEMWNVNNNTFHHFEEYLGYNLNCNNIISYAPSANGTTKSDFESVYGIERNFSNFNFISARDIGTQKLVYEVSNIEPQLVLDPTLLMDSFEPYVKDNDLKDYIVLYGYNFSPEEIKKIEKFAKEKNKKIYSLGFKFDWCDNLEGDILEFLGFIKNADYTIINTFHGLLFSLIFEKEFALFSNGNNKVLDILERFGIQDRDAIKIDDLNEIFDNKVDYESINKIKLEKRKESIDYLIRAIEQ